MRLKLHAILLTALFTAGAWSLSGNVRAGAADPPKPSASGAPSRAWEKAMAPTLNAHMPDVLGVAHVAGDYHFTEGDFLNEGADEILRLGSRVIKVWFMKAARTNYPFGPPIPEPRSLVDLARSASFRRLFAKPFTTFILETYSFGRPDHYWRNGVTSEEAADERRQFRELATYLLKTYAGTGKTFILQPWEGDWAIRPSFDASVTPTPEAIRGMIEWLNARQDGVEEARRAFHAIHAKPGKVAVWHAAEVNLLLPAMAGKPSVTNNVLPHTHCDLYSYSAYDTSIAGDRFVEALNYLASKAPDSAAFGAKNLYVGEFGVPEREFGEETTVKSLRRTIEDGRKWGLRYLVHWQLYDNECKETPATHEESCRGFWLITPTGRRSAQYDLLQSFLRPKREEMAPNPPTK